MKQKFNPTAPQIEAAQDLVIAMAFYQTVKPAMDELELSLLRSEQYHYSAIWYDDEKFGKRFKGDLPEDRILRNPKDLHMMDGIRESNMEETVGDAKLYYDNLRKMALAKGFVHGENAECMADNDVRKAERNLITATYDIHGIDDKDLYMPDHRKKMVDILLKMYTPLVTNDKLEKKQRLFYDQRIIPDWLFIGVYSTCYVFCDNTTTEFGGDFKELGRLMFSPLQVKVYESEGKYQGIPYIIQAFSNNIWHNPKKPIEITCSGQTTTALVTEETTYFNL